MILPHKVLAKNERGNLTLFVLVIIMVVVLLTGLFLNLSITYLNINFSKKALDEAVRSRAMAVDIPLKEQLGVVEVINYPHSGSNGLYSASQRPIRDTIGNIIPCNGFGMCGTTTGSVAYEYRTSVEYAETFAKNNMINGINSYSGKDSGNKQALIEMGAENICFDVQPLPENDGEEVTFTCALKSHSGEIYTVSKTLPIKGYNDSDLLNHFNDDTLTGNNTKVKVNNVVFGASVVEPRALFRNPLYRLGYKPERTRTFIYSIAYPQIDKCYGEFC